MDLFTYKGYWYFGGLFYSWGLDFLNGRNILFDLLKNIGRAYFHFFFSHIDHHLVFVILGVIFELVF